jgi:hypothetical protein
MSIADYWNSIEKLGLFITVSNWGIVTGLLIRAFLLSSLSWPLAEKTSSPGS